METGALLLAAFLLGGVPTAYLAVRLFRGTDVRTHGSGNVGATNAARLFPPRRRLLAFLGIFLVDAGKGYAAAGVLPGLFGAGDPWPALAALAAVLGHSFTPFLSFRGGKGVATTLGALLALEPVATGIAVAVFFAVYLPKRVVSLGSLAVAVVLPVAVYVRGVASPSVGLLALGLGLLIVVRHRTNIARILSGQER